MHPQIDRSTQTIANGSIRMKISLEEIRQGLEELQIPEFNNYLNELADQIKYICNSENFQGESAKSMKAYFSDVHGTIIQGFLVVLLEMEVSLKQTLKAFNSSVDSDERARID